MYALDNSSGVTTMPVVKNQQFQPNTPRWFTEGGNGVAPSYPGADWFNIVQAELLSVLTEAQITPDKNNLTQLAQAVKKIISDNTTAFTALHDLFIGVPIPYPLATVPAGCLAMNGQRFDKNRYPKLAQKYPSGVLPDMRGEFPRGWDNGRGVDAGRVLLSFQAGSSVPQEAHIGADNVVSMSCNDLKTLNMDIPVNDPSKQIRMRTVVVDKNNNLAWHTFPGAQVNGTHYVGSTRPRNIAFHYICLAA